MKLEQLEEFKRWFADFVGKHYGDDEYVNTNLKLKEVHTLRVCEEARYISERLNLDESDILLAEAIALFHDTGRFIQFVKYRTYNDCRSVNHCQLSLCVLKEDGLLDVLDASERQIILDAVEFHGIKELPAGLDERTLLHCKLVRDADKLDIYRVVLEVYEAYLRDPKSFRFELEFPDSEDYSKEMVEMILDEQMIDYRKLRTLNDMKLLQLGWVFDVNFAPTLERIKEKGYIDKILSYLPETADIVKVAEKVNGYIDSRISVGGH